MTGKQIGNRDIEVMDDSFFNKCIIQPTRGNCLLDPVLVIEPNLSRVLRQQMNFKLSTFDSF